MKLQIAGCGSAQSMWQRQIHFFAMRYAVLAEQVRDRHRLRVVHDADVEALGERREVLFDRPQVVDLHRRLPRDLLVALEAVVDRLRDLEELLVAVDDAPLRGDAEVIEQRDLREEDLGDAAAVLGRVDVQDRSPACVAAGLLSSSMTASSTMPRNSSIDRGQTGTMRIGLPLWSSRGTFVCYPTAAANHSFGVSGR